MGTRLTYPLHNPSHLGRKKEKLKRDREKIPPLEK